MNDRRFERTCQGILLITVGYPFDTTYFSSMNNVVARSWSVREGQPRHFEGLVNGVRSPVSRRMQWKRTLTVSFLSLG